MRQKYVQFHEKLGVTFSLVYLMRNQATTLSLMVKFQEHKIMIPVAKISAPAKAILCGQHAVVYGQDAIAFAVDLNCYANVYTQTEQNHEPNSITLNVHISSQCKSITFNSKILALSQAVAKTVTKIQFQSYSLYEVEMCFQEFCTKINQNYHLEDPILLTSIYKLVLFCHIFSITPQNLTHFLRNSHFIIQTTSQIPIGKGLGSSASFNSVLAASLLIITEVLPRSAISSTNYYKGLVNHLSKVFQKVEHGRPSGIDNFVSIYGGMVLFNRAKNPQFQNIQNPQILSFLSEHLSIGFVDSGIEKNTKLAVSNVLQKYNLHQQGDNKYKNMIQEIGQFPAQIIVLLGQSHLNQNDMKLQLFDILKLNHTYLRQLGLSNKEIEQIVDKYTVEGKSVAKITGAGMGGVVLIVGQKPFITQTQSTQTRHSISSKMNTNGLTIHFY